MAQPTKAHTRKKGKKSSRIHSKTQEPAKSRKKRTKSIASKLPASKLAASASSSAKHLPEDLRQASPQNSKELKSKSPKNKASPKNTTQKSAHAAEHDVLTRYMEELSHIPLFTPEDEQSRAAALETHELHTWKLLLKSPRGLEHIILEAVEAEEPLRHGLDKLAQSYRRAAARTKGKTLRASPTRTRSIEELAPALREFDMDKERLERIMARLRREVWGRRYIDGNAAFRLNHADLTPLEKSFGNTLRERNRFVRANLRLVVSVARNFHNYRIPFIDLIQEGNVGLLKAVHRFDHRRGFRFSTYAHWWIRQSIERAIINKGSQVRLPVHVIDSRRRVARAKKHLRQTLGRAPTLHEISQSAELPKAKVQQVIDGIHQDPISLNESVGGDDTRSHIDLVRDDSKPGIEDALIREKTHDQIRVLLQHLNPIEKDVIRRRFGLGSDDDQTLEEIGKIYNLSRERVRQIQAQGLQKIRRLCNRRESVRARL